MFELSQREALTLVAVPLRYTGLEQIYSGIPQLTELCKAKSGRRFSIYPAGVPTVPKVVQRSSPCRGGLGGDPKGAETGPLDMSV
jgi:hypothetical protein